MRLLATLWGLIAAPTLFLAIVLPVALLALPFSFRLRLRMVQPAWKVWSILVIKYVCWSDLSAEDQRTEVQKGYPPYGLYLANHQSYIDIPLLMTHFQIPPIMKQEVLYIPVLGLVGWVSGALILKRSSHDSRKKVYEQTRHRLVEEKIAIQVYPEGTRSKVAAPKDFSEIKTTLIKLAFEENLPIYPVSIYGTRGVLSRSGLIKPGRKLGLIIHRPLEPKDFKDSQEMARAVWGQVQDGYLQLQSRLKI